MINKRQLRRLCLIFLVLIVFLKSQKVINNSIKPSLFVSGWGKFHGWRLSKPVARDGDISCPSLLIVSYSICLGKCVEIHYNSCWKMVFCAFNWHYWLNRIRKNSHKEWYYSSFLSQKTEFFFWHCFNNISWKWEYQSRTKSLVARKIKVIYSLFVVSSGK